MAKAVTKESILANNEKKCKKIVRNAEKLLKASYAGTTFTHPEIDSALNGTTDVIRTMAVAKLNAGGWNVREDWIKVPVEGKTAPEQRRSFLLGE